MSGASVPVQQIETLLRCPVCLDRYNNPRILPCQHTFCRSPCLQGLINNQNRTIKCPECRSEHRLPSSGSDGFPINITLSAFLDLRLNSSEGQTNNNATISSNTCAICEQESETFQCFHCNKNVCAACKEAHVTQARNNVHRLVNELKKNLTRITNQITNVSKKTEELQALKDTLKKEVTDQFLAIITDLHERENVLLNDVEAAVRGELIVMQTQLENLELDFVSITSYCESLDGDSVITNLSENDLLSAREQCSEYIGRIRRIENISLPDFRQPSFQRNGLIELNNTIASFGRIISGGDAQAETREDLPNLVSQPYNGSVSQNARSMAWEHNAAEQNHSRADSRAVSYTPSWSQNRQPQITPNASNRMSSYMYRMDTDTSRVPEVIQRLRMEEEQGRHGILRTRGYTESNRGGSVRVEDSATRLGFFGAYDIEGSSRAHGRQRRPREIDRPGGFMTPSGQDEPSQVRRRISVPPATAFEVALHGDTIRNLRAHNSNTQLVNEELNDANVIETEPTVVQQTATENVVNNTTVTEMENLTTNVGESIIIDSGNDAHNVSSSTITNPLPTVVDNLPTNVSNIEPVIRSATFEQLPSTVESVTQASPEVNLIAQNYINKGEVVVLLGNNRSVADNFKNPKGVAVSKTGDIIIADGGKHRVQMFDSRGQFICTFGSFGSTDGKLNSPAGVACKIQGQVMVTDSNCRIQLFNRNRQFCRCFGQKGSTDGKFDNPVGVYIDDNGTIFVCDKGHHCVQVISREGQFQRKIGRLRTPTEQLESPEYVYVHNNLIYVTDSSKHHIIVFTIEGAFVRTIGQKGSQNGQLKSPAGIAVDIEGNIIVCERDNYRVQIFDKDGRYIHKFGSKGDVPGQFKRPEGLAITSQGQIVVSDYENGCVQIF